MKLYLIRHAETVEARNGITTQNTSDIVVDEKAKKKIKELKKKLIQCDYVFSSPLLRSRKTTNLLFSKKVIVVDDRLVEKKVPDVMKNTTIKEYYDFWNKKYKKEKYDPYWSLDGGESHYDFSKRVYSFFKTIEQIKDDERSIAIVAHGTFFRHFLCAVLGIDWQLRPDIIIDVMTKMEIRNLDCLECSLL